MGIMEEFVQKFRRAIKESKYEERALVEEFKRKMNRMTRKKLIEVERSPKSIEQWYKHATNLDRYLRKSRRKKERLRNKKEGRTQG